MDSITNDGKLIVDNFNIFFSTVGENLVKAFNSMQDLNHIRTKGTTPGKFHFIKIPEEDVLKLLMDIDGNKTTDVVQSSSKLVTPSFVDPWPSLASGVVPSAWKKKAVSPIFKEVDHLETSNYRPISVIPAYMKMFEKLVFSQLHYFDNLLSSNQSGIRAMHSTQTCLLEMTDYLLDNFNSGLHTETAAVIIKTSS